MTRLVFLHGWSYGPDVFDPLCAALSGFEQTRLDLGYASEECVDVPGGDIVLITHSFGLMWWLHHRPFKAAALIALNGFTRFAAGKDFAEGIAPRVVARMRRRLKTDANGVLRDFQILCDDPDPDPAVELHLDRLDRDLDALQHWDEQESWQALSVPKLALAGEWDRVVPPALTNRCFDRVDWAPGAAHLLPKTAPDWCAEQIKGMLTD